MSTVGKNMIIKMKNSVLFRGLNNSSGNIIVEIPNENKMPNRKKIIFLNRSLVKSFPKTVQKTGPETVLKTVPKAVSFVTNDIQNHLHKELENENENENENSDKNKILKYYKKINEIRQFRVINGNQENKLDIIGNMIAPLKNQNKGGKKEKTIQNNQTISVQISKKDRAQGAKKGTKIKDTKKKLYRDIANHSNNIHIKQRNLKINENQMQHFQTTNNNNNNNNSNLTDPFPSFLSIRKCLNPESLQKSFSLSQSIKTDNTNIYSAFPKINSIPHNDSTQIVQKGTNQILNSSNVIINKLVKKHREQQIFILKNGLKNLWKN